MNQTILKLHKVAELSMRCGQEMCEGVEALGRQVASPDIKKALFELLNWPAAAVRVRCVRVLAARYWDDETRWAIAAREATEKSPEVLGAIEIARTS